jgi:hypothetical protein
MTLAAAEPAFQFLTALALAPGERGCLLRRARRYEQGLVLCLPDQACLLASGSCSTLLFVGHPGSAVLRQKLTPVEGPGFLTLALDDAAAVYTDMMHVAEARQPTHASA